MDGDENAEEVVDTVVDGACVVDKLVLMLETPLAVPVEVPEVVTSSAI